MTTKTNFRIDLKNAICLGFALFAILFGAGNLIFPPILGLENSTMWHIGYFAYFIADVGLAMLSLVALVKSNGSISKILSGIGKIPSRIISITIIVCIGPLLAIPRTAATSFEMISQVFTGAPGTSASGIVFSIVFFILVVLATFNPTKAIDTVGKVLTPFLIIALCVLIVIGFVNPAAPTGPQHVDNIIQNGVLYGYQSMDMMGSLFICVVIMKTITSYGYKDKKTKKSFCVIAGVIASTLLLLVYGGLAYLGATTGQLWAEQYLSGAINPANLLANISNKLLGNAGATVLSIAVLMACLTTAIGLVSACSDFFRDLLGNKFSHHKIVIITCAVSLALCNIGLTQIINIAAPILTLLYPVVIVLEICYIVRKEKKSDIEGANVEGANTGNAKVESVIGSASANSATTCSVDGANIGCANNVESTNVKGAILGKIEEANKDNSIPSKHKSILVKELPVKIGSAVALVISFCSLLVDNFGIQSFAWVHSLPFDEIGTNWLIPTVIAIALGICIEKLFQLCSIKS